MEKNNLLPNVIHPINLILVNLATACTPERSFSTARRLKTWLRATMQSKRFNALALLNVPEEMTDKLDLLEVENNFIDRRDHRHYFFKKFIPSDFIV